MKALRCHVALIYRRLWHCIRVVHPVVELVESLGKGRLPCVTQARTHLLFLRIVKHLHELVDSIVVQPLQEVRVFKMLDHLEMFMLTLRGEVHSRLAATLHDLM